MKRALVCGGGGFIGSHLVRRLKEKGYHVTVADLKKPEYWESVADEYCLGDLRDPAFCESLFSKGRFNEIYQLAADMGGAGFVFTGDNDADILTNSAAINRNILLQAREKGCDTLFYSSSVCCYPADVEGKESDAYPANPPSDYGWEKLFSERMYLAHARNYGLNVRIARFHNTYGPYGTYKGGREKAPAAMCRKVAEVADGGVIEVWGDGKQQRPFIYIDDLLDGIDALVASDFSNPVNLGPSSLVTIDELVQTVAKIAGKQVTITHVAGPTGEQHRHVNNQLAQEKLGWTAKISLIDGLKKTYPWIAEQVHNNK